MTIDEPTIAPRAGRAAAPRAASSGSLRLHLVTLLGVAYALSLWAVARSSDRPAPRRPERVAPAAPVEARPRAPRTAGCLF